MKTCIIALIGLLIGGSGLSYAVEPVLHEIKLPDPETRAARPKGTPPTGLEIVNPAEFCPADGVLLAWSGWGQTLIADIARAVAQDDKVFLVVANSVSQTQAYNYLTGAGVDMTNVEFITYSSLNGSSMWIRDYGPFCIQESGRSAIVDYIHGGSFGNDNMPFSLAADWGMPAYDSDLMHHGGNHLVDGNGMGFVSTNIYNHNSSYSQSEVRKDLSTYLGVDSLVVFEPMAGDGTGHVDMFCKLLNDTLFVVGEYETPEDAYGDDYNLLNNLAAYLDTLHNLDGREFEVARIPMPPYAYSGPAGTINYTYTNSLIINQKVLVPVYGFDSDAEALQIYADLMPGYDIVGIDSAFIIGYWGAVHCVTNLRHSDNPLMVFHEPVTELPAAAEPVIKFRINPKVNHTQASVWYKPASAPDYVQCVAALDQGVWSAQLPSMTEDFSYYIAGVAHSGPTIYPVQSPSGAPGDVYDVDLPGATSAPEVLVASSCLTVSPNPFNPTTTAAFEVWQQDRLNLSVYDLAGRHIATLADQVFAPGTYNVSWHGQDSDGRQAASGVYIMRLSGASVSSHVRVSLVK